MSKKVKCINCDNFQPIALPVKVHPDNLDYAKDCSGIYANRNVCMQTLKVKPIDNEQYCKHIKSLDEKIIIARENERVQQFKELEQMIIDCETEITKTENKRM